MTFLCWLYILSAELIFLLEEQIKTLKKQRNWYAALNYRRRCSIPKELSAETLLVLKPAASLSLIVCSLFCEFAFYYLLFVLWDLFKISHIVPWETFVLDCECMHDTGVTVKLSGHFISCSTSAFWQIIEDMDTQGNKPVLLSIQSASVDTQMFPPEKVMKQLLPSVANGV